MWPIIMVLKIGGKNEQCGYFLRISFNVFPDFFPPLKRRMRNKKLYGIFQSYTLALVRLRSLVFLLGFVGC